MLTGQRSTVQPSFELRGCDGRLGYFASAQYLRSHTAFSSATAGPTPYHDATEGGQILSVLTYRISTATRLRLLLSAAANNNQLPNVPGLAPQYVVQGMSPPSSQQIASDLNFRDGLLIAMVECHPRRDLTWQLAYSLHTIVQAFRPDILGELAYQGVASTATHRDLDNSLQGHLTVRLGPHTLRAGFYVGGYSAHIADRSLVFTLSAMGSTTSTTPVAIASRVQRLNWLSGLYVDDLWQINPRLSANVGLRWDRLTGFTDATQLDPTINLSFRVTHRTTVHGGFARDFQVPIFQGISPSAPQAFSGTTAAGPPGAISPVSEADELWDVGLLTHITSTLSLSEDNYYELTRHYLDTGQFGVVPIFAPFNYEHGYMWGSELGVRYARHSLSMYANVTLGRNWQQGVATGQFNFDPAELTFIDTHPILLDHQPLIGATTGFNATWREFAFGLQGTYSSGLRAGFADQEPLPLGFQIDISIQRSFTVPGLGTLTDRLSVLNLFDRINLLRPAAGIGIFQSAYGPRRTVYDTLTVPL